MVWVGIGGFGVFLFSLLGRPGGDLLSHALRRSTIGAEGFHDRVRDGIGWYTLAMTTRPSKQRVVCLFSAVRRADASFGPCPWTILSQADRAISTGKLHALPRFHTRPINVMVYHGSQGRPRFEGGFPLRCFQRLSRPDLATQLCGWRHNWSTRGPSTPVLSY